MADTQAPATARPAHGDIYYVCAGCADGHSEGCCHEPDNLRILPDGRWICFDCYDNEPGDFAVRNSDEDAEFTYPRWQDFPRVPDFKAENDELRALLKEARGWVPNRKLFERIDAALGKEDG